MFDGYRMVCEIVSSTSVLIKKFGLSRVLEAVQETAGPLPEIPDSPLQSTLRRPALRFHGFPQTQCRDLTVVGSVRDKHIAIAQLLRSSYHRRSTVAC